MSRGKPEPRQLDLSLPMLRMTDAGFACEDGLDARNYGDPTGIPRPGASLARCWACRRSR